VSFDVGHRGRDIISDAYRLSGIYVE
jgi:hypothetical protein